MMDYSYLVTFPSRGLTRVRAPRAAGYSGPVTKKELAAAILPENAPLPLIALMATSNQAWPDWDKLSTAQQEKASAFLTVEPQWDLGSLMADMITYMPDEHFARVPGASIELAETSGAITGALAAAGYDRLAALTIRGMVLGAPHPQVLARLGA